MVHKPPRQLMGKISSPQGSVGENSEVIWKSASPLSGPSANRWQIVDPDENQQIGPAESGKKDQSVVGGNRVARTERTSIVP